MPGDRTIVTTDPSGVPVSYTEPTATDIVDPAPAVGCSPLSGSRFPVGDTTVTCSATDGSGNRSSASFDVHVSLAAPTIQAAWEEPVGAAGSIAVSGSRTIPVKVRLTVDGSAIVAGSVRLHVSTCAGTPVGSSAMARQDNGRWMGHLSTDGLADGCYRVSVVVDGQVAGGFDLNVGPAAATGLSGSARATPSSATSGPATGKPTKGRSGH